MKALSSRLNYYLAGGRHPWGFHVTNLILHGVVSVLFTFVFSTLFSGQLVDDTGQLTFAAPKAALLCGLLFTAHPIHTESVSCITFFSVLNIFTHLNFDHYAACWVPLRNSTSFCLCAHFRWRAWWGARTSSVP